ncbi:MAG: hypothetical protein GTO45_25800 [Candidatus Aminicenantes bacterium]|nr:hypothetical protein [Candidatus Aminicenantes bacterium]NIM82153.1 hypothetical protein [Candidatus Aminicenantes bacterium]NIN21554.1 hypothetical protein [Candidatus Aminicenantes bacterium]NIN45363.1 hypothetical protein [Candidatus Aminicenantes bacterium]NIN88184.1 hypothetical protein [Candidatus Aminicenantes bacterium]
MIASVRTKRNLRRLNHTKSGVREKAANALEKNGIPKDLINYIMTLKDYQNKVIFEFIIKILNEIIERLEVKLDEIPKTVARFGPTTYTVNEQLQWNVFVDVKYKRDGWKEIPNPEVEKLKERIMKTQKFISVIKSKRQKNLNGKEKESLVKIIADWKIWQLMEKIKSSDIKVSKAAVEELRSIGGEKYELIKDVLFMLQNRIPDGKNYDKEEKVYELLPQALNFREEGYDFLIKYYEEKWHIKHHPQRMREIEIKIVTRSYNQTYYYFEYMDSRGRLHRGSYKIGDVINVEWETIRAWDERVTDSPEKVEISCGKRIN